MCFAKREPASILAFNKSHLLRNRTSGVSANSLLETIDVHSWTESACTENKSLSDNATWRHDTGNAYETVDVRVFREYLVEARNRSKEDYSVHVIEERNPGSCQKNNISAIKHKARIGVTGTSLLEENIREWGFVSAKVASLTIDRCPPTS